MSPVASSNAEGITPEEVALLQEGAQHHNPAVAKAARWALQRHGVG